jgi:hypothetical protein
MIFSIARFISFLFNPVFVFVFVPFLILFKSTNNLQNALYWTGYTVFFLVFITLFILYGVKKKIFTDIDVSKREQRPLLFFTSIILAIFYLAGLFILHGPFLLFIIAFGVIMGIFVASIINTRIKASIHVATISSLIVGLALAYGGGYFLLLLFIPLVAWSRIIIKRHTVSETIVGGILGILLSLVIAILVKVIGY